MDELEISGRRYISSKRAGKEHKYHPDYIGQLVRGGKVAGQKVGRAWYVDADSLSEYLSKDLGPKNTFASAVPAPEVQPEKETQNFVDEVKKSAPVAAPVHLKIAIQEAEVSETIDVIATPEEAEEIIEKIEDVPEEVQVPSIKIGKPKIGGLTYLSDDAPLFPAIKKGAIPMTTIAPRFDRVPSRSEAIATQASRAIITPKKAPRGNRLAQVGFIAVLGVLSFGIALGASYFFGGILTLEGSTMSAGVALVNIK